MEIKSHLSEIMQCCFLQAILLFYYLSVLLKTNFLNNNKNNNNNKKTNKKKKERKNSWFSYALSQFYTVFVRKLFLHVSFIYVFII